MIPLYHQICYEKDKTNISVVQILVFNDPGVSLGPCQSIFHDLRGLNFMAIS